MTREQTLIINVYCRVFGLIYLGAKSMDELTFCDWVVENPKSNQIWSRTYNEILNKLEMNIGRVGQV
jgi:hypothetical protein